MFSSPGQTGFSSSASLVGFSSPYSTICCSLLFSTTVWLFLNGFHFFFFDFSLKMVTSPLFFMTSTSLTGVEGGASFSSSEGLVGFSSPGETGFSSSESLVGSSSPGETGLSSRIIFDTWSLLSSIILRGSTSRNSSELPVGLTLKKINYFNHMIWLSPKKMTTIYQKFGRNPKCDRDWWEKDLTDGIRPWSNCHVMYVL